MTKARRVAMLIELPKGSEDITALRRCLKMLLRLYGLRCIALRPPEETETFKPAEPATKDNEHAPT